MIFDDRNNRLPLLNVRFTRSGGVRERLGRFVDQAPTESDGCEAGDETGPNCREVIRGCSKLDFGARLEQTEETDYPKPRYQSKPISEDDIPTKKMSRDLLSLSMRHLLVR